MTLLGAAAFWASTFGQVFLLGFQSRNVNTGRYGAAAVTSLLVGTAQLIVVRTVLLADPLTLWALTATAGPAGIVSSMLFSRWLFESGRPPGS